jgi:hypothetical protein
MIHRYITERTIDLGAIGEVDCTVTYGYCAGTPESGRFGLPENYDPGSDSEFDVDSIKYKGVELKTLFSEDGLTELENEMCLELDEQ